MTNQVELPMPTSSINLQLAEQIYEGTRVMLKHMSLVTLTVQNTALYLMLQSSLMEKRHYIASTAVVMTEVIKLVACVGVILFEEGSLSRTFALARRTIFFNYLDTLKVATPPILYMIHANLLHIGSSHLHDTTAEILSQFDIVSTAIFWILLLRKKISNPQWVSLALLFAGVAFVQVAQLEESPAEPELEMEQNPKLGFAAIFFACVINGFAGVYYELILKSSDISVWMRSIQQSVVVIPVSVMITALFDYTDIVNNGFFHGYTTSVWCIILLQAFGSLLVGIVVLYSDNIRKMFASSVGLVCFFIVSIVAFNFDVTIPFCVGSCLIVVAHVLYLKKIPLPF